MTDGTSSTSGSAGMPTTASTPGRFKPSAGEKVLMCASMFVAQGEAHASDLKPGSYRAKEAKVFLTSTRLVVTGLSPIYLFGPFVWLGLWLARRFRGPQIVFALPLASVAVVEAGTAASRHFAVWSSAGQKFSFKPSGMFARPDGWIAALTAQVRRERPDAAVVTEGRSTFFQAGEVG